MLRATLLGGSRCVNALCFGRLYTLRSLATGSLISSGSSHSHDRQPLFREFIPDLLNNPAKNDHEKTQHPISQLQRGAFPESSNTRLTDYFPVRIPNNTIHVDHSLGIHQSVLWENDVTHEVDDTLIGNNTEIQASSVVKKRRLKMNKHKHRKRRKRDRRRSK